MGEKMVLVDGNSLMHRAFHALPLLDNGQGVYTNGVYGFLSMLFKVLREEQPRYGAVAFDLHGPTFRHQQYDQYKAGRAATPDELRPQFDVLKELLSAMHIRQVSLEGLEADDMLGILSKRCEQQGIEAVLVTGDRDSFQLAGPHTTILYTKRGITDTQRITPQYLMDTYALTPDQMIDLKGLMGDSSDNIPGVPGVGEKTALKLLSKYHTLEGVLEQGAQEEKGKLQERLIQHAQQARFSKELATILREAPLEGQPQDFPLHHMNDGLKALEKYKLSSLMQRLSQLPGDMLGSQEAPVREKEEAPLWGEALTFETLEETARWAREQKDPAALALALEEPSCALPGQAQAHLPLGGGDLLTPGVTQEDVCRALAPLVESGCPVVVPSLKTLLACLPRDVQLKGDIHDAALAAYAIDPQQKSFALEDLLREEGIADGGDTLAARLWELSRAQKKRLEADGLTSLYQDMELPLAFALRDMEKAGFLVDEKVLLELGEKYKEHIQESARQVYELAGETFNLNSPKQLGDILFEKMGLPGGKKTSKGWSTAAEILENIAGRHEIVSKVLEYRKYFKLNSTYIQALLRLRGQDGRVHTQFDQVATATGRISSNEPNLQNIPVRTPKGRQIRRAFVAPEGHVLVDADYSQIELRVLAHMSQDETLVDAFRKGQDIHRRTAAEVYGLELDQVTGAMRSAAKAVNFGIIYGISDFGLANNIGITRAQAREFIDRYFARYPRVKAFMDGQVTLGQGQGYVTTLFGRRRYLKELASSNFNVRSFGQRAAMNSPIQGTAADIIKLAMIRVDQALKEANLGARLILQVHDELIVECPEENSEAVSRILKEAMEGAADLMVPLQADLSIGRNWHECKG